MKLVKTTFFSGLITIIKIGSSFIAIKVVAGFTGPAGVAIVGQFSNFITIVLVFANGAINTGVVKYTAEHLKNKKILRSLFSTSLKISIYCSLVLGLIIFFAAPYFSQWLFKDIGFKHVFWILGCTIIFYSINTLLISILNGLGEIKWYTLINAIGNIIALLLTIFLVFFYKVNGALYALILAPSISLLITLVILIKNKFLDYRFILGRFDKEIGRKLSRYSLMAIVTALTVPMSQIFLRNFVISALGMNKAGIWQGIMRISDGYLLLITTSLSTYYLPKLSSLTNNKDIRKEIFYGYRMILPIVLMGCLTVYFLRFFLIRILYNQEFLSMEKLFFYQLTGDFFKIAAWLLAYLMLAKAQIKIFIATEIIFSGLYILLGRWWVGYAGLEGITIAFMINYLIYFLFMAFYYRKLLLNKSLT